MTGNMNSVLFLVEMLYRFNNQCNAEIFTLRNDEMKQRAPHSHCPNQIL